MATFGERLKELRKERDLSQEQVAEQIGVAGNTVAIWERGERAPKSIEICSQLADFFEVSESYMLGLTDKRDFPEFTDELGAETAAELEKEIEEHMLKLYRDLSPEMQEYVHTSVVNLWRKEKSRGLLQSQQEE